MKSLKLNMDRLQRVENTLSSVVCTARYHAPKSGWRRSLHWFPIKQLIIHKIAIFTFKVQIHGQPVYLADLIVNHTPSQILHFSGKDLLVVHCSRHNSPPGHSVSLCLEHGMTCQFTCKRPANWYTVSHYCKQLMKTTRNTSVWHWI